MKFKLMLWFGGWVSAWLDILCGACSVLTLTLYRPWWDMSFRAYWSKKLIKCKGEKVPV